MEIKLREAELSDIPRINELVAEMFRAIDGRDDAAGYGPGALDYYFSGGEDWICVAETDGQIIAFLSMEVHREEQNFIYLDDFCVDASCRGQGVGTAMLNAADDFARKIGFSIIVLHVKMSNEGARRLYQRHGYAVLDDDGDRFRMIKRI